MRLIEKILLQVLLLFLWIYQKIISDFLKLFITGSTHTCRFYPSCGDYAHTVLKRHGPFKGTFLSLRRLIKCHPFSQGGLDPAP